MFSQMKENFDIKQISACVNGRICYVLWRVFLPEVFHQTFVTEDLQVLFVACHCRTESATTYVVSSGSFLGVFSLEKCMNAPVQKEESCSDCPKGGYFLIFDW